MTFSCPKHGVYEAEFPHPTDCGFCASEARVVTDECNRILAALLAYIPADDLLDTGGSSFDEAKLRALLFPN